MAETSQQITDTDVFPAFDSKADFLDAFEEAFEQTGEQKDKLREVLYRLSNTDTSDWADPTVRHDA